LAVFLSCHKSNLFVTPNTYPQFSYHPNAFYLKYLPHKIAQKCGYLTPVKQKFGIVIDAIIVLQILFAPGKIQTRFFNKKCKVLSDKAKSKKSKNVSKIITRFLPFLHPVLK